MILISTMNTEVAYKDECRATRTSRLSTVSPQLRSALYGLFFHLATIGDLTELAQHPSGC